MKKQSLIFNSFAAALLVGCGYTHGMDQQLIKTDNTGDNKTTRNTPNITPNTNLAEKLNAIEEQLNNLNNELNKEAELRTKQAKINLEQSNKHFRMFTNLVSAYNSALQDPGEKNVDTGKMFATVGIEYYWNQLEIQKNQAQLLLGMDLTKLDGKKPECAMQ